MPFEMELSLCGCSFRQRRVKITKVSIRMHLIRCSAIILTSFQRENGETREYQLIYAAAPLSQRFS